MAKQKSPTTVGIAGLTDVRTIAELHRILLHALQQNDAVQLQVDGNADVDLTFVQLVESARRHAAAASKTVSLTAPAAPGWREILQRGGFLTAAADRAFWLHQAGEH